MIHLVLIQQKVSVHFHLHRQNRKLVCGNFQLIWLAVEAKTVDGLQLLLFRIFLVGGPDKSKLDVGIQVSAEILEWKLELLNALSLLNRE